MSELITKDLTLVNELGMHLRAAGKFVQLASKFEACILIRHKDIEVDGKSIMGILSLAAPFNAVITITAQGPDAQQALDELAQLVSTGFNEGVHT